MAVSTYSDYAPLDEPNLQIRVLRIRQSMKQSGVCATLEPVYMSSNPRYDALSWCWGRPGRNGTLLLNGKSIQIRENLQLFLQALVRHYSELVVWVDALCINQNDNAEKSLQVMMMGEIYRRARRVFAWLGYGDSDSDYAFYSTPNAVTYDPTNYKEMPGTSTGEQYQCFEGIFRNTYWTRLWTLQERVLANELWIACGAWLAKWQYIDS